MDALHSYLKGFLPDFLILPAATTMIILIGYFLSKILASVIFHVLPKSHTDTVDGVDVRPAMQVSRFIFWTAWSATTIYALWPFETVRNALYIFVPGSGNFVNVILVVALSLFSIVFIVMLGKFANWIVGFWPKRSENPTKLRVYFDKFLGLCGFALVIALIGLATLKPDQPTSKSIVSVLLMLAGLSVGKLLGEVVKSLIRLTGLPEEKMKMPIDVNAPFFHRRVHAEPSQIVQALIFTAFVSSIVKYWSGPL